MGPPAKGFPEHSPGLFQAPIWPYIPVGCGWSYNAGRWAGCAQKWLKEKNHI